MHDMSWFTCCQVSHMVRLCFKDPEWMCCAKASSKTSSHTNSQPMLESRKWQYNFHTNNLPLWHFLDKTPITTQTKLHGIQQMKSYSKLKALNPCTLWNNKTSEACGRRNVIQDKITTLLPLNYTTQSLPLFIIISQ